MLMMTHQCSNDMVSYSSSYSSQSSSSGSVCSQPPIHSGYKKPRKIINNSWEVNNKFAELESAFCFDPKSIELKNLPQCKVQCTGLDNECREKFINFNSKMKSGQNVFAELFRKDVKI